MYQSTPMLVGNEPGVTKRVSMPVQVSLRDNLYFIDSQGILDWPDQVTKLKLAALKLYPTEHIAQKHYQVADLALFYLNRFDNTRYVRLFNMDGPSDNIDDVVKAICVQYNLIKRTKSYKVSQQAHLDKQKAAEKFCELFSMGALGPVLLDDIKRMRV